jgi:hypothetical protein
MTVTSIMKSFMREKPSLYTVFILAMAFGASVYSLLNHSIFSCSASGYDSDTYLSYCNASGYGDYDHGAIWFGLEPAARAAAANASVLFLGNSRTQFAFSSKATADWFTSRSVSYYLLGFSHNENHTFEAPLLRQLHPRAKVYVINIDSFFQPSETGPGRTVMHDPSAMTHYNRKRQWQAIHRSVCTTIKAACGNEGAFFRSRSDGGWVVTGGPFPSKPVSYDERIDENMLTSYTALAAKLLPELTADRACTMLTIVPTVDTAIGTAKAVGSALGITLVAPKVAGLMTFDTVHLDMGSAERGSAAFLEEAGPQIRECVNKLPESQVGASSGG